MSEEKKELLYSYMKSNVCPILIKVPDNFVFPNSVYLSASCEKEELVGYYKKNAYFPPKWLSPLFDATKILVIDKIDSITKEEQLKFKELLKAKKISTFGLPKDTVIIVTYNNLNINEEIYGLMAHIKD